MARYTAKEIRSRADEFKEYLDNPNHFAVKEIDDDSRVLMEMLYQAAALQEREEREKRYEYGVCPAGEKGFFQSRTAAELERLMLSQGGFEYPIVRREVGEWEEVWFGDGDQDSSL